MSHYINLLEDSERHYHSAAKSSQLLKIGAIALVGGLILGIYLAVSDYQNTMQAAETYTKQWKTMEGEVEQAKKRLDQLTRLDREANTLKGWSSSRYAWQDILTFLQRRMPEPSDQFQFTRLYFDENMVGLRTQNPDSGSYAYPLRREVRMELQGIIQGDRVEPVIAEYEENLRTLEKGTSPILSVRLENITSTGPEDQKIPQKKFNFTLNLQPRTVKP